MNGLLNSRHLYTRFLIGQSQSYDVSSANQEQGGKWICRPHTVIYARWLDALMRAVCYLAAYIDDNGGLAKQEFLKIADDKTIPKGSQQFIKAGGGNKQLIHKIEYEKI